MSYALLREFAGAWDAVQRSRLAIGGLEKAAERAGERGKLCQAVAEEVLAILEPRERAALRTAIMVAHTPEAEPWLQRVAAFVDGTRGLGPALLCLVGLLPPLPAFANPAKLWKYVGLHVNPDGRASRHPTCGPGCKLTECAHIRFSPLLRAYVIARIVGPIIRDAQSPYRSLYDQRKAYTQVRHPEWGENPKAPKMHYERDAQRYVAKRVLRDVWRAAVGQVSRDTLRIGAEAVSHTPAPPLGTAEAIGHTQFDTHWKHADGASPETNKKSLPILAVSPATLPHALT